MNARGFTLLEVLVALAILGVAVVASIQGFAQGLRLLKLAGDHQDAMLVADEKLREVVDPSEGSEEGTETRFRWKRTIVRVATPELTTATQQAPAVTQQAPGTAQQAPVAALQTPWSVYQIDVHVEWDEKRAVHLATLRTISNLATSQTTTPTQPGQSTSTSTSTSPGTPRRTTR